MNGPEGGYVRKRKGFREIDEVVNFKEKVLKEISHPLFKQRFIFKEQV